MKTCFKAAAPLRFAADHWNGRLGLFFSAIITLFGLRVILAYAQEWLPPDSSKVLIIFWLLANLAVFIWQLTGTIRAINRRSSQTGDPLTLWACYSAVLAAIVITGLQAVDIFNFGSPTREEILLANYTPPEIPVSSDGTIAYIRGDLNYRQNSGLQKAIAQHPQLRIVELESDGGLVYAARSLALNISRHKLDTRVKNNCSSSCTLVFLAGRVRTLDARARLGFHQYALLTKYHTNTLKFDEELERDRQYLRNRGITMQFISRMFDASPDKMWYPTRQELIDAKVITGP